MEVFKGMGMVMLNLVRVFFCGILFVGKMMFRKMMVYSNIKRMLSFIWLKILVVCKEVIGNFKILKVGRKEL